MMDCSKDFNEENSEPEQHHAGTEDRQDDETNQGDSKGRKTNIISVQLLYTGFMRI
jgi:hypothetical protein